MSNTYSPTPHPEAPLGAHAPSAPSAPAAPAAPAAPSAASATADAAKEQASTVASDAASAAQNVAETAKDQAATVAGTVKTQAKDLITQTQGELREQAGTQQKRVATGLRSLSDELGTMAEKSDGGGVASDLVQQAASRAGSVASWLDDRDPGTLLEDVKGYARRKPGTFIAIAAVAGIVAGRLTRSLTSAAADEKEAAAHAPSLAATPPVVPLPPVTQTAGPVTTGVVSAPTVAPVSTVPADESLFAAAADPYNRDADVLDESPVDGDPYYRDPRS